MKHATFSAVIHASTAMAHQMEFAVVLQKGFQAHGINVPISTAPDTGKHANIHVVLGPHFALRQNLAAGRTIIMLDRCLWGDHRQVVSLAWLDSEGRRVFPDQAPGDRDKPELVPYKTPNKNVLYLADWGFDYSSDLAELNNHFNVYVRQHPASKAPAMTLAEQLQGVTMVAGRRTSALVESAILGNAPIVMGNDSPVMQIANTPEQITLPNRAQWLNNLSYTNFAKPEIEDGTAIGFLLCQEFYKQHPQITYCR